jgi:hypothetical protein
VVFHHRPNTDKIIGIADGLSRLTGRLQDAPTYDLDRGIGITAAYLSPAPQDVGNEARKGEKAPCEVVMAFSDTTRVNHERIAAIIVSYANPMGWYELVLRWLLMGDAGLHNLKKDRKKLLKRQALSFCLIEDTLHFLEADEAWAECVIPDKRDEILSWAHDGHGHFASLITQRRLRGMYWWPTRTADCDDFCKSCPVCQACTPSLTPKSPTRNITAFGPMTLMGIDFIGPISPVAKDGSEYILLGVDYFSRFILLQAVQSANGYWVATTFMMVWSCFFGWPEEVYCDNGSHFKNDLVKALFAHHGTGMTFGPVSHPASTGLPARCVRLVRSIMTRWSYTATDEEL